MKIRDYVTKHMNIIIPFCTKSMNDNIINVLHVEKIRPHLLTVTYVVNKCMDLTHNSGSNYRRNCVVIQFSNTCIFSYVVDCFSLYMDVCFFLSVSI